MDLRQSVNDLIDHIKQGKIIEAMEKYYDPQVSMRENSKPPTVGLAPNIEREKQFMSQIKEWKGFTVTALGVGDGVALIENTIEFINTSGKPVRMEQVAVQRWRNGKIVEERFYYDSAG